MKDFVVILYSCLISKLCCCFAVVGHTNISGGLNPIKVSDMLDRLYTKLDTLCKEHDVQKVETIGDAFMVSNWKDASLTQN